MTQLSKDAQGALLDTTGRRGAIVPASGAVAAELEAAGLVGVQYGITEKGLHERLKIQNARLDEAF